MGLFDFLFGTQSTTQSNQLKKTPVKTGLYDNMSEDDYFENLYDDACSGDQDAIQEMREEFGDDWQ